MSLINVCKGLCDVVTGVGCKNPEVPSGFTVLSWTHLACSLDNATFPPQLVLDLCKIHSTDHYAYKESLVPGVSLSVYDRGVKHTTCRPDLCHGDSLSRPSGYQWATGSWEAWPTTESGALWPHWVRPSAVSLACYCCLWTHSPGLTGPLATTIFAKAADFPLPAKSSLQVAVIQICPRAPSELDNLGLRVWTNIHSQRKMQYLSVTLSCFLIS